MMKSLAGLTTGLIVLGFTGLAAARPIYYAFDGTVNDFRSNIYNASDFGITVGETSVHYVFEVDFNRNGYTTSEDGSVSIQQDQDFPGEAYNDNFYVNLLAGTILNLTYNGVTFNSGRNQDFHPEREQQGNSKDRGILLGGSLVMIMRSGGNNWKVEDWHKQPENFFFTEQAKNFTSGASADPYLNGSVTLTSISTHNPVPTPPPILLLGSGFAALARRVFENRSHSEGKSF